MITYKCDGCDIECSKSEYCGDASEGFCEECSDIKAKEVK